MFVCESRSVVSNSLRPHGLYSSWNSLGQYTGVGSLSLLQGIFPTQGSNQVFCIAGRFFTSWATREPLYLGIPDAKNCLFGKNLVMGKIEVRRRRERQRLRWLDTSPILWTWVWVSSGSWWCTGKPGVLRSMGWQRVGYDWVTELNVHSPPVTCSPPCLYTHQVHSCIRIFALTPSA